MIYGYTISGTVEDSGKKVSCTVSVPMGLSKEDFLEKITAFCKAFKLKQVQVS